MIGVEAAASPAMSAALRAGKVIPVKVGAREHGLIAEGAGAAPGAGILAGAVPVAGQTVAVISGRNITLQALAQPLQAG